MWIITVLFSIETESVGRFSGYYIYNKSGLNAATRPGVRSECVQGRVDQVFSVQQRQGAAS